MKPLRKKQKLNESNGEVYLVSRILSRWHDEGRWYYEVLWKNYSRDDATWEPHENLTDSLMAISDFYRREYGRPREDLIGLHLEMLRKDALNVSSKQEIYSVLGAVNLTFAVDLAPTNVEKSEKKVRSTLTAVAVALAVIDRRKLPCDYELRARGVAFAQAEVLISRRKEQLAALTKREREINDLEKTAPITLENNLDLDHFPNDARYITEMVLGRGVVMDEDPPIFCTCNPCTYTSNCCCTAARASMPYNNKRRLRTIEKCAIFECNKKCKCGPDCPKRVVQHGRQIPLTIYKTENMGWGVKATKRIPRGTFICEYLGEMITAAELSLREPEYTKLELNYAFDIDFADNEDKLHQEYSVDATYMGNVARYINHGCSPNAFVQAVWVDCLHLYQHKLALFALTDIPAGQQILFDYPNGVELNSGAVKACLCKAPNCRGSLFPKRLEENEPIIRVESNCSK